VTFAKLQEQHAKAPDDADTAARLAEQYLRRRKAPEARRLVDGVLVKQPEHPLANLLKARLLKAAGDEEGARRYLEAGAKGEPPDPRLLLELGKVQFEAKQFDQAAATFEKGRATAPLDGDWAEQLAAVYAHTGQKDRLTAVLEELTRFDPDDLPARQKLAKLLLEAGRSADAERVARDGLLINVTDAEVRNVLYAALAAQRKDEELVRMKKLLEG
jgi:Tfp pilus assembly protein PilF